MEPAGSSTGSIMGGTEAANRVHHGREGIC